MRDQALGSPGNLLDLYAASDVPETKGTGILRAKFASSAAPAGKPLASAEAATWVGEHFLSTFADVRAALGSRTEGGGPGAARILWDGHLLGELPGSAG